MINLKFTLLGNVTPKKNNAGKNQWTVKKTDKSTGLSQIHALKAPITFYPKEYVVWAKTAIQKLTLWRFNNPSFKIINEPVFFTCIFFKRTTGAADISNLLESVQDVLSGRPGGFLDKTKTVKGKKYRVKFNHDTYKIIEDDNYNIIKDLGSSTVFFDPKNPRVEVFITSFSMGIWADAFRMKHPGAEIGITNEELVQQELITPDIYDPFNLKGI
jgi:hypothetical protein